MNKNTINPKIVDGYNAQGHAIINNNKALEETIAAQEKLQKKALKDYIEPDSLQKLINARNINGTFRGATSRIVEDNKYSFSCGVEDSYTNDNELGNGYLKYPVGKINWLVNSKTVKDYSDNMNLGNSEFNII